MPLTYQFSFEQFPCWAGALPPWAWWHGLFFSEPVLSAEEVAHPASNMTPESNAVVRRSLVFMFCGLSLCLVNLVRMEVYDRKFILEPIVFRASLQEIANRLRIGIDLNSNKQFKRCALTGAQFMKAPSLSACLFCVIALQTSAPSQYVAPLQARKSPQPSTLKGH